MKLLASNVPRRAGQRGNILLVSLVITGIIGFLVVSYLRLVQHQGAFTMRTQVWDSVMPIVEAGVEEAMAHLNTMVASNLAANGWTFDVISGGYTKTRTVGEGFYVATITYTNIQQPLITSTGSLPAPVTIASSGLAAPGFLASVTSPSLLAVADPTTGGGGTISYITRTVRVLAQKQPFFAKGMVSKHTINLNGNNIAADSFDSSDPNYSGAGGAYDPAKHKDNGDIATNSGILNPLNAGNANIKGNLSTGPGGGIDIGPTGSVGDDAWVSAGTAGIQPGHSNDDMNVGFMDVQRPFTGGAFTPGPGVYNLQAYNYVLGSGNYEMSSITMSGSSKMVVTGNAVLYVPGNISVSGMAMIEIAPGASLKLYVGGATAAIGGKGLINRNTKAETLTYFGLPSNRSLSFSGNSLFIGGIYAPNAALSMYGGGNNVIDFIGASVTQSVTMNGHFNFHYDEALGDYGPTTTYTIVGWNEI